MGDLRWQQGGVCASGAPDLHFPAERNRSPSDWRDTQQALQQCARCPLREVCLEYALDEQIGYGIWGGTTARERNKIRKARAREQSLLSAAS